MQRVFNHAYLYADRFIHTCTRKEFLIAIEVKRKEIKWMNPSNKKEKDKGGKDKEREG